ncbi:MAG: MOSC domain-containing protein [Sulfitobacter sp.]|nr:MOSC domain-containing protein [Sulfitobacter sp.]
MQVTALYRHPIKSHGRECLDAVTLVAGQTMPWDRTWAVTHEASKAEAAETAWVSCHNFMIGTRTPALAGIWARLDEVERRVTLTHQDLGELSFCPDEQEGVAAFLNWVAPLCPENRACPTGIVTAGARGMTDSDYPSVSLMNVASHRAVEQAISGPLELERWRGNIWIDGAAEWEEFGWLGRNIQIGAATLRLREPIERCAHTTANPRTGQRDADTLGTLERDFGHQDFGIYAEVVNGGEIRIGDKAVLQ